MKEIVMLTFLTTAAGCLDTVPYTTGLEGKTLPDFKILLTDSITWIHSRNIPGDKPIIFFYFSPDCPYCKAQTKEIIDNMTKLEAFNFYFVTNFSMPSLKAFSDKYKLSKYPNIICAVDSKRFLIDYFQLPGVPYLAIYGKEKKLKKAFIGNINSSQLKRLLEK